jgi:hypothetical protein
MEIVVNLSDLSQILVLHLPSSHTLLACFVGVGEQNLVDNDVVNVDFLLCEFNSKSLGFIH